jgi:putative DNA primase/helicase
MKNYDEVLRQLQDHGLVVTRLEVTGREVKTKVVGRAHKQGWYRLHLISVNGDNWIVGGYGIWDGNSDNGYQKISGPYADMSAEQRTAVRERIAADLREFERREQARSAAASAEAQAFWAELPSDGRSDYLERKKIQGYGVRYTDNNDLVVPIVEADGRLMAVQLIYSRENSQAEIQQNGGKDKRYWPKGVSVKGGHHWIGTPGPVCLVAEGYATGASLRAATGLPVLVVFSAGNIQPALRELRKQHKRTRWLICADDDDFGTCGQSGCKQPVLKSAGSNCGNCGQPHKCKNAGIEAASSSALLVNGSYIIPRFSDDAARFEKFKETGTKITDFNDLHCLEGLSLVRKQVEAALQQLQWNAEPPAASAGEPPPGGRGEIQAFSTVYELLSRFSLVYAGDGVVFDHVEHRLMKIGSMRDACRFRELSREWQASPDRRIVRLESVGFDPAGTDPEISCNLWAGWPTQPAEGDCSRLLDLLMYMCEGESDPLPLYNFIVRWLAYPLQNPGAKMKTTIVVHGPQGTGKNLFFETVMGIYGRYGRVIDQNSLEDKFNDWASAKLFLIADETVARQELYHVKNKLKSFITGDWIRINPKGAAAYDEKNHANLVFLSNERMPTVLEEDDRRHAIVWTPAKLEKSFYDSVVAEIKNGGRAALHHYLLNVEMGDFDEHAKPPMTEAKRELIDLSRDSIDRFRIEWGDGTLGLPVIPALTEDVFDVYRAFCARAGFKSAPINKVVDKITKSGFGSKERKRYSSGLAPSKNPQTFLVPAHSAAPGAQSESVWLGECVAAFLAAAADYKAGLHQG